jgi:hypothetical protein
VKQVVGAAALEAADRVLRFDLEDGGDAGAPAERLADELRRVEENGVDDPSRLTDPFDPDGRVQSARIKGTPPRG